MRLYSKIRSFLLIYIHISIHFVCLHVHRAQVLNISCTWQKSHLHFEPVALQSFTLTYFILILSFSHIKELLLCYIANFLKFSACSYFRLLLPYMSLRRSYGQFVLVYFENVYNQLKPLCLHLRNKNLFFFKIKTTFREAAKKVLF